MMLLTFLTQFVVAMLGTLAFAVLFNAPKSEYFYCALSGGLGWLAYYIFTACGVSIFPAAMVATFILTILSRMLSVIRKKPVTIFLVTGIFPLVPGAGIYYTSYYLIVNDLANFSVKGTETFKFAGAIVIGIIFGSSIPQTLFHKINQIFS